MTTTTTPQPAAPEMARGEARHTPGAPTSGEVYNAFQRDASTRWLAGLLYDALLARPQPALEAVAPDLYATAINCHAAVADALLPGWRDLHMAVPALRTFDPVYRRANKAATTFRFMDGSALKVRPGTVDWATWYVPADPKAGTPMPPLLPTALNSSVQLADVPGMGPVSGRVERMFLGYQTNPGDGANGIRVSRQGGKLITMGWVGGSRYTTNPLPCGVVFGQFLIAALNRLADQRQAEKRSVRYHARQAKKAGIAS